MKRIKNIVLGGIQHKVFNLVLVTIILMVAAFTAVIIYQNSSLQQLVQETNEKQQKSISEISAQTMDGVLENTLVKSTRQEAYIANKMFMDVASLVRMLAHNAASIFENSGNYHPYTVSRPIASKDGEVTLQLLTEEGVDIHENDLNHRISLAGNMADMMKSLYSNTTVNSCYIALPEGVILIADDRSAEKFAQDGSLINVPVTERPWYKGAVQSGELYFTDVETDVFSGQVGIMCSMPVYKDGELMAVVGADLYLDAMAQGVANSQENGGFNCIVNSKGHVVFSPMEEGTFMVTPAEQAQNLRFSDNKELADFLNQVFAGNTDIFQIEVDGHTYYMTGSAIETVGWAVLSAVSKDTADTPALMMEEQHQTILEDARGTFNKNLNEGKWTIIILLLVILIAGSIAAIVVSKRIVKPLESITKSVRSLSGNNLRFVMKDEFRTKDEIEVLAESFADLSGRTVNYMEQIRNITAEKERIGTELNMATAIQASQLPRLFPAFPNRPEFDIYAIMDPAREVGGDFYDFFLVDDDHLCMVIADVSGKGVPAALFMMVSRVLIKSCAQSGMSPSEILEKVNNQLAESNEPGFFVTVWIGILEISTGNGMAANAGHEHPALRRSKEDYTLLVYRHSPVVAAMEDVPFRQHEFHLDPGDSFFVYTDGVPEAANSGYELFGTDRLLEALNRNPDAEPKQLLNNVLEDIRKFVGDAEQFDDITMMSMKYFGPNGRPM